VAKPRSIYVCSECGGQSTKWQGQCPHCEAWNGLVESVAEPASRHRAAGGAKAGALTPLAESCHERVRAAMRQAGIDA